MESTVADWGSLTLRRNDRRGAWSTFQFMFDFWKYVDLLFSEYFEQKRCPKDSFMQDGGVLLRFKELW